MSRALVVSGGGSKGAYAAGVADVLVNEGGLTFDVVSGTSTGGLLAPFVAAGAVGRAVELYTSVTTEDILTMRRTSQLLRAPSLASYEPLIGQVRKAVAGGMAERILSSSTRFFLAATRLQDRTPVFLHNQDAPAGVPELQFQKIPDDAGLVRAMVATASIPGLAPPVDIGDHQFVDGGVREMTPLAVPVAMGVEEVWVILLSPRICPPTTIKYTTIASILGRTADTLLTDVSQTDLSPLGWAADLAELWNGAAESIGAAAGLDPDDVRDILDDVSPRLASLAATTFHVIAPDEPLIDDSMRFDPPEMKAMVEKGREAGRKALGLGGG